MKVSSSEMRDKFGLSDPKTSDELLQPLNKMSQPEPLAMNRRLAINRVQQSSVAIINDLTDEAMADWVELGGDDFMSPVLKLAEEASSFEEFNAGLSKLQSELSAEQFTEQMARLLFQVRGLGDAQDA